MSTIQAKNVGKGTPTVWWDIVPNSDQCEIYTYMAGGGCTLPGNATVLMPGEGYEGVTKFVLDRMTSYGLNACPPLLVGVAVNVGCWSHRRGHIVFDKDLHFTIDTHTGFTYKEN